MKPILVFALLLFAIPCLGATWTDIHGTNSYGDEIRVVALVYDPITHASTKSVQVTAPGKKRIQYPDQDCEFASHVDSASNHINTFSCSAKGESPLAGTTYVLKKWLAKCEGGLYVCESGCSEHTPLQLIHDEYECDTSLLENDYVSEYIGPCHPNNQRSRGITNGESVRVRDKPDLSSNVLAKLPFQARVRILDRQTTCVVVDYNKGQWVKIKSLRAAEKVEGWVFDAFIDYVDRYPTYAY